jgi:hypothetical protein
VVLKAETDDNEADGEEHGGGVGDDETGFGVNAAVVPGSVELSAEIVQPVAGEPADENAHDPEEVEVTDILSIETVEVGEVEGDGGVDTNDPGGLLVYILFEQFR